MTYEEAVKLLKSGPLRFGDETQIKAVITVEAIEALRDEYDRIGAIAFVCGECGGSGEVNCGKCEGEGECPHCDAECSDCDGTGKIDCEECADLSEPDERTYKTMTLETASKLLENLNLVVA